jgi:Cutinase
MGDRSEARSRATERGPVLPWVLRHGHGHRRDHPHRRHPGERVARLSLAALLLVTTLAATLPGSPVAAQTASSIVPVPGGQGANGGWVSPAGYAVVAFNDGTGHAARLVAIRPADGSELFSVDLPGNILDVTFDADGEALVAVNNTAGDDQGWVFRISVTGAIVQQRDLAPYVWPNQIEFGADGRLYATTFPSGGNGALLALDASSLAVETAVPLSEIWQLHARSSGLVLIQPGTGLARFFGYADLGNPTAGSSRPSGITFSSVTPEGAAYTLWYANSVDGERCSAGAVLYAAPDGVSREISTGPLFAGSGDDCRLADLEALPGGGAAIAAVAGSSSRIVWIDPQGQGQRSAERVFDSPLEARLTDLRVDGAGIVTLATTVFASCPPGEFENDPCAAVDLVGYDAGAAVSYTTTIHGNQAAGAEDDSVQVSSWIVGGERLFVGAGFVMLAGHRAPYYCGLGCSPGGPAWLFAQAPVSRRAWEDPATGSTSPPPSEAPVQVSPSSGVVGTTFTAKYDCSASPDFTIMRDDGQPATGVSLDLAVSIGSHYTRSFQLNTSGSYVVMVHCGADELRSPAINVTDRPQRCNTAALIGVRGSGDNLSGDSYPGRHAVAIAGILLRRWGIRLYDRDERGFGAIGLSYPASTVWPNVFALPSYGTSVDSGRQNLLAELDTIRAVCGPTFPILLVGFSQGAHVIQSALESLDDAAANQSGDDRWRSIAGVVLLASPRFDPNDPAARGTFAATYPDAGFVGKATLRSRFGDRARSYCVARDPVCNKPIKGLYRWSVHSSAYDEGRETGQPILEDAAGLLAHRVRALTGGTAAPTPTGELAAYDLKTIRTVLLSGAAIYARGAPTVSFEWDLNDDRVIDLRTPQPLMVLGYRGTVPRQRVTVTVRLADGSEVARCIRLSPSGTATC